MSRQLSNASLSVNGLMKTPIPSSAQIGAGSSHSCGNAVNRGKPLVETQKLLLQTPLASASAFTLGLRNAPRISEVNSIRGSQDRQRTDGETD